MSYQMENKNVIADAEINVVNDLASNNIKVDYLVKIGNFF